jgi:hypothetical protein
MQNMKTGPDVLNTAENESVSAKYKNGTQRPRYHPKTSSGAQNRKMGVDAHDTAENKYVCAKLENGTRRPRNR